MGIGAFTGAYIIDITAELYVVDWNAASFLGWDVLVCGYAFHARDHFGSASRDAYEWHSEWEYTRDECREWPRREA